MEKLYLLGINLPYPDTVLHQWVMELLDGLAQWIGRDREEFSFLVAGGPDEAEKILFEQPISCILAGTVAERTVTFLTELKEDELFKFLPVALVISSDVGKTLNGYRIADTLLKEKMTGREAADVLYPVLRAKIHADELTKKVSFLQDELMKNYLLIDLIKRYVPKTVWDRANLFAEEQTILIPEYEEEVAIIYGDIKGFTQIAEHRRPKEVIDLLNDAYTRISRIVYGGGGDIDKFIGDAFLAVHSDPSSAIQMAIQMQQEMQDRSFKFRMGVHFGPVVRGNVGSDLRSDNTLIGDTVNTAARIQEVAEPGEVAVSETVLQCAGISIPSRYRMEKIFKGKEEPLVVYNIYKFIRDGGTL
jgi:class 3 adenylate cyclase